MRLKVFIELVALGLVPLLLVSVVTVVVVRRHVVRDRLNALTAVAQIQEDRVESFLKEQAGDYALFLSDHSIVEASKLFGECASNPNTERMNALLTSTRQKHAVEWRDITLVDHDGCVQASTDPDKVGDDLSEDPLFEEGSHELVVGELRFDPANQPTRPIVGPLLIDGFHIATVVFDSNLDWLVTWARDYTGLGKTGETLFGLLDDDRSDAIFMTPLRFAPDAAFRKSMPMSGLDTPIVQALLGNEAEFETSTDYRGVEVLAVTRQILPSGWGVVVKMDRSETMSAVTNLTRFFVVVNIAWLAILVAAAAAIARRRTEPIRKITDTAVRVAAGDLDQRVTVHVRDELGVLAHAVNNMTDELVERQRMLEDEVRARTSDLRGTVSMLEHRNQDLERMAVVAAHDLSEPLRKIRIFGERLADTAGEGLDDRSRDYLERMTTAAERMQDLIDGLLEYSRVTTRAQPFELVDLGEVARDVVSDLEVTIAEVGATVEIGSLPTVMGEPTQLRQLIQNLIVNSVTFHSPGDEPWVRISSETTSERGLEIPGAVCRLIVEDHGIGIPKEYAESVFDLFTRLQIRDEYPGSGLGLSICRRIAEHHQGTITVEPNTPAGTKMIVTLPIMRQRWV